MKTLSKKIGVKAAIRLFKSMGFKFIDDKIIVGKYIIEPSFILRNIVLSNNLSYFYAIMIIRSGISLVAVFKGKELIEYKKIERYTVRKKQGKSQDKHLKTKGKSRLGSRIRLREIRRFFKETREMIGDFKKTYNLKNIFISVPKVRLNLLKGIDLCFIKIPRHIEPSFSDIKKIVKEYYYSKIFLDK